MAKRAQLADGTVLEFPDDTPDSVMDTAVQTHMRDTAVQGASSWGAALTGPADLALSAARGTAHQLAGTAFGIGGLIHQGLGALGVPGARPDETYMGARQEYLNAANADQLPIKGAQLRTPEGQQLAQTIGNIPLPMLNGAGGGPHVGRVSDVGTALGNLKAGAERLIGPELTDAGTSLLTAATARGAGDIPDLATAARTGGRLERGVGATADSLARAEKDGFTPTPMTPAGRTESGATVYAGTKGDRTASVLGGQTIVDSRISVRNQANTDRLGAKAIFEGLPKELHEEFPTPANVEMATDKAREAYKGLEKFDVPMMFSADYLAKVGQIGKGVEGFKDVPSADIDALRAMLDSADHPDYGPPSVPRLVQKVQEMRDTAYSYINSTDTRLKPVGKAYRQGADLLDNQLEQYLAFLRDSAPKGSNEQAQLTRMFSEYIAARRKLSIMHDIRDSMGSGPTGTIDAAKVADLASDHKLLSPELQKIANAYSTIGQDGMKNIQRAAKVAGRPMMLGNAMMGAVVGSQLFGKVGAVTGALATLGPPAAQAVLRGYALRGRGFRRVQAGAEAAGKAGAAGVAAGEAIQPAQPEQPQ